MRWSRLQPARSESSRDSGVDGHTLSQRLEISLVPRASRSGSRATMFEQSCSGRELSWSERTSDPATSEAAGGRALDGGVDDGSRGRRIFAGGAAGASRRRIFAGVAAGGSRDVWDYAGRVFAAEQEVRDIWRRGVRETSQDDSLHRIHGCVGRRQRRWRRRLGRARNWDWDSLPAAGIG
jgi:hypothetical protein